MNMSVKPVSVPELPSFFARPQLITQYQWTTGSSAGTVLYTLDTGSIIASNDLWASKIKGFANFRGTLNLRVVINAQPFQQGRLLCHLLPFKTAQVASYAAGHNINLCSRSQQPNVEVDCRDSSGHMRIPWIGPAPWFDVKSATVDWGTFYIVVLSPLLAGTVSTNTVQISLFAWFEDAEFSAPTFPQSKNKRKPKHITMKTTVDKVAGSVLKTDSEHEAAVSASGGPISNALNVASRVAETLGAIPILTEIAEPVSWACRVGSGIASVFGWAKPNNTTVATYVVQRGLHNGFNCEGNSYGEALSVTADPCVSTYAFAGSEVDEMSIDYIKAIPAFVISKTWNVSDAIGTSLFTQDVSLAADGGMWNQVISGTTPNTVQMQILPPFAYLAQGFAFWRGPLKLHLKFIKTEFHSGRILVTWTPRDSSATAPDVTTSSYSMREIIDVREASEYEIVLPYMIPRAFCRLRDYVGKIQIIVLNPLIAPDQVANNIQMLMYWSAGDELSYAVADTLPIQPIVPQAGGASKVLKFIGNENPNVDMPEEFCIGERILSIKQLIARYSRLYFTGSIDSALSFIIYPWAVGVMNAGAGTVTSSWMLGDSYSFWANGFALARGGMRYCVTPNVSNNSYWDYSYTQSWTNTVRNVAHYCTIGGATLPVTTGGAGKSTSVFSNTVSSVFGSMTSGNAFVNTGSLYGNEVLISQNSQNPMRLVPLTTTTTSSPMLDYSCTMIPFGTLAWSFMATHTYKYIARSAAEDAQLGYFIGFLPVLIGTS